MQAVTTQIENVGINALHISWGVNARDRDLLH